MRLSRFKSRAFGGTLSVTLDSDAYAAAWAFAARRREQALTRAVARLLVIGGTPPRHLSCGTTQCATEAAQSGPVTGYDQAAVIAPAIQPGRCELVETHVQDLCAGLMRSCPSALCLLLTSGSQRGSSASLSCPKHASLWGLARCSRVEQHASTSRLACADLGDVGTDWMRAVRLTSTSREAEVTFRNGAPARCLRLAPSKRAHATTTGEACATTHMLGGVSSALGELTARWLAGSKAARALVSWSCTAPRLGPIEAMLGSMCSVHRARASQLIDVGWLAAAS